MRIRAIFNDYDSSETMVELCELWGYHAEAMYPQELVSAGVIYEAATVNVDVLMIPLTLPRFSSLHLARLVHLTGAPTRLLLNSATDAPQEKLLQLFDRFMSRPAHPDELHRYFEEIRTNALPPPRRWHSPQDVEAAIETVVNGAYCFRHDAPWNVAVSWAALHRQSAPPLKLA